MITAELIADAGAAATEPEHFFRSPQFLSAEGVTHSLLISADLTRVAVPLIVRGIPGSDRLDATSPYSYPGGARTGPAPALSGVDFSDTGLVSLFLRDRLADPVFTGGTERSLVQVSDPAHKRKSRPSDRAQMRKNTEAGYRVGSVAGPESGAPQRDALHRVYTETMQVVEASERYLFEPGYFAQLLESDRSWLFEVHGPGDDVAAAAIVVESDGFIHYYLSGTADAHRRRAPSKNLITAVIEFAERRGMPMNLGGGLRPGDGLEEFKRGFANTELPFITHEIVADPVAYAELAAGDDGGHFPAYRSG